MLDLMWASKKKVVLPVKAARPLWGAGGTAA